MVGAFRLRRASTRVLGGPPKTLTLFDPIFTVVNPCGSRALPARVGPDATPRPEGFRGSHPVGPRRYPAGGGDSGFPPESRGVGSCGLPVHLYSHTLKRVYIAHRSYPIPGLYVHFGLCRGSFPGFSVPRCDNVRSPQFKVISCLNRRFICK